MIKRIQDTPQTIMAIVIAFGCLLELEGQLEDPIAEDITHFEHMIWTKSSWNWHESFLHEK